MKPTALPVYEDGLEYRQLHPTREGKKIWRFANLKHVRVPIKGITEENIYFYDRNGKCWGRIDRFGVLIHENYWWNGCSPKRWVWPFGWIGTCDFRCTILASLVHDFLYQFAYTEHFPLSREEVDAIFYHIIAMSGDEPIAGIYHGAVRKFASWKGRPKNGEYSTLL